VEELKDEKMTEYAMEVTNRLEALGVIEEERSPDELWKETKEVLLDVAEKL